jgi:hypothetical protein
VLAAQDLQVNENARVHKQCSMFASSAGVAEELVAARTSR